MRSHYEQPVEEIHPYTAKDPGFWKAAAALAFGSLLIFAALYAFQPLLPVFVEEFEISATASSLLVSSSVITMIIGLLVLGFQSDRIGRTAVMKLSLLVTVVTLLLMPFVHSFWLLILLRSIQGFFLAGIPAAAMGYLGDEVKPASVGMAMSIYIASNALGGLGGRVASGYLTDLFGWETALLIMGGFGVLCVVLFYVFLPPSRFFEPGSGRFMDDLKGMAVHLKNRRLLILFSVGLVLQIVFTSVWTYLPFYLLEEPFNLSLKWIALTYFTYGLGVIAPPIAGRLSATFGLIPVMLTGIFIMIAGVLLTAPSSVTLVVIGLALICTGFFIAHSMASASVSTTARHHKSGASSFYLVSYYIGVALGSTAVGGLWDAFNWIGILATVLVFVPVIFLARKLH